jgi:hypothetical protein
MKTWIGRSAPFGKRTLRPTSTLSPIGAEISREGSAGKGVSQAIKALVERIRLDRLLADRAGVGDRMAITHHIDPALAGAEEARPRDLDPGLDALIGRVLAEGADGGKPTLTLNLLDSSPSLLNRFVERVELLPPDTGPVPARDLPAHGQAD